jgi:hypothetical protein
MRQDLKFTVNPADLNAKYLRETWLEQVLTEECSEVVYDGNEAIIEIALTLIKLVTKPLEPLDAQLKEVHRDFPQQVTDAVWDIANQYWGA